MRTVIVGIDFSAIRVPQQRAPPSNPSNVSRPNADDPRVIYQQLLNDPALRAQLRESNPALSDAIESGNFGKLACSIFSSFRKFPYLIRVDW